MKPTAVKRCIIEFKGQEGSKVSLCTLTTMTDTERRLLDPNVAYIQLNPNL